MFGSSKIQAISLFVLSSTVVKQILPFFVSFVASWWIKEKILREVF
jgi:hypothetical protein